MSATDEVRRLLDERGVEYRAFRRHYKGYLNPDNDYTNWSIYDGDTGIRASFHENEGAVYFNMSASGITPEQAIGATLGLPVETDETGFVTRVELDGWTYVPEPVRCRDCKHFESDYTDGAMFDATVCWAWDNGHDYPNFTTPDGFCHRGERKSS